MTLLRRGSPNPELIQHPPIRLVPYEVRTVALAAEVLRLVAGHLRPPLPAHELHQQGIGRVELGEDEPVGGADRLDVGPAQEIERRRDIRRHVGVLELGEVRRGEQRAIAAQVLAAADRALFVGGELPKMSEIRM